MTDSIQKDRDINNLLSDIRQVLQDSKRQLARTVNSALVATYWQVGRHIVEFEQGGKHRAEYNKGVIDYLSIHLKKEFGSGFNPTNLRLMRRLFLYYPNQRTLSVKLSWSHYNHLLKVEDHQARDFYVSECEAANWSVRQLQRQINTMYYERLLASRDKETVRKEIQSNKVVHNNPREIIHDPYVLEFLGLSQGEHFLESDLEQALISRLQHFLLELGRGFTFVARQKRISFDNKHFYIDLLTT
ncbi:MAG: PDDEXK nuclease domain-containing protein [Bacteroidales bacterium]|nr:PDDEXK nuclease domain-containing protein [Bacteroidales bacterium]